MIRFIILLIWVIFLLIFGLPLQLFVWVAGLINRPFGDKCCMGLLRWAFGTLLTVSGTDVTIIGKENIPEDETVLYVANHRSYFDIIVTYRILPRITGYIAKTEMLRVPILVNWMKLLHCSFLNRKDIKQGLALVKENIENLKNGISVFVFPEGTRNKTEEVLLPFHNGSLKMAEKSDAPIVPVTINNTEQIFEAHMPAIKKAHVIVEFGKPIYMKDMTREEKKGVSKQIQETLTTTYLKNAELI